MPDFSDFRPARIWRRLPAERRLEAAELFWMDEESGDQHIEGVAAIASHMKFRTKTVIALPLEKRTKYLASLPNIPETVAARALVSYHLARQRPMMTAFLDKLGIPHEDGLITDEDLAKPDTAKLKEAAAELGSAVAAEDVSLYFATLVSQDPDTWGDLADLPETRAALSPA